MIIIGHDAISYPKFQKIFEVQELDLIDNTSVVWFDSSDDDKYALSQHCLQNGVKYALKVHNITDFVIYAALKPEYIILEESPQQYQKIAETYLLDLKILYVIDKEEEIGYLAEMGIDGVIFRQVLG